MSGVISAMGASIKYGGIQRLNGDNEPRPTGDTQMTASQPVLTLGILRLPTIRLTSPKTQDNKLNKLHISIKSTHQAFEDFKAAAASVQARTFKGTHHEICLESEAEMDFFAANLNVLTAVASHGPRPTTELANALTVDISELESILDFYSRRGVLKIESREVGGAHVRFASTEYDTIDIRR